jgi:hypothetical protein
MSYYKYNCETCGFFSDHKSRYSGHLSSYKHKKMTNKDLQLFDEQNKLENLERKKKDKIERQKDLRLIKKTSKPNHSIENDTNSSITKLHNDNKEQQNNADTANNSLLSNGDHNNNTVNNISIKAFIKQYFNNAPEIKKIPEETLNELLTDKFISSLLLFQREGNLHVLLGDIIVEYYKKDNPENQSLWTTDIQRLACLVRTLINENLGVWNDDKNSLITSEIAIKPLLEFLKKYINETMPILINRFNNVKSTDDYLVNSDKLLLLNEIKRSIDNCDLSLKIIKHILPHFHLTEDKKQKYINTKSNESENKEKEEKKTKLPIACIHCNKTYTSRTYFNRHENTCTK